MLTSHERLIEEQARAICKFLRFMAQQDEEIVSVEQARTALSAFWGKFCNESV